jgi:hypothetical protein
MNGASSRENALRGDKVELLMATVQRLVVGLRSTVTEEYRSAHVMFMHSSYENMDLPSENVQRTGLIILGEEAPT